MTSPLNTESSPLTQAITDRDFQVELLGLIPNLRAFAIHLCGRNLGEDMAQDTLTKAWRARVTYRSETKMKAWLFTILRNEYISHRRRAWREVLWDQETAERIPTPPLQQEWESELSDLRRALLRLPVKQREALLLITDGAFSYAQAAVIASAPVGTVKSRVTRARAALMNLMNGTDAAPRRTISSEKLRA